MADDVRLRIPGQPFEGVVAEDDRAIVLVRIGQDHRHPAHLDGGEEDILTAIAGCHDVATAAGVVMQIGGIEVGSLGARVHVDSLG